jgi:inorganic pyrophosphatase/exopolyphosphatase
VIKESKDKVAKEGKRKKWKISKEEAGFENKIERNKEQIYLRNFVIRIFKIMGLSSWVRYQMYFNVIQKPACLKSHIKLRLLPYTVLSNQALQCKEHLSSESSTASFSI